MTVSHDPFAPGSANPAPVPVEASFQGGTTSEILAWVGDDKERAQTALEAEQAQEVPRKNLMYQLERVLK